MCARQARVLFGWLFCYSAIIFTAYLLCVYCIFTVYIAVHLQCIYACFCVFAEERTLNNIENKRQSAGHSPCVTGVQ